MEKFISEIDKLPKVVKIILCLPIIDIIWAVYRIIKGVTQNNPLLLVVGILWIVFGSTVTWVADIIGTALNGEPWLID